MGVIATGTKTSVFRTGGTLGNWNVAGPSFAVSTGYVPGSVAPWLRVQILPSAPLAYLPSSLTVFITGGAADPSPSSLVKTDAVVLGTASAQTGIPSPDVGIIPTGTGRGIPYRVDTHGFSLSDLNSGNVYLWIGCSCFYAVGGGTMTITSSGTDTVNGVGSGWTAAGPYGTHTLALTGHDNLPVSSSGTFQISFTGFTIPVIYYLIRPSAGLTVSLNAASPNLAASNSLGGTYSSTSPSPFTLAAPDTSKSIPNDGSVDSFTQSISVTGVWAALGNPLLKFDPRVFLSPPPSNTATFQSLQVAYTDLAPPKGGSFAGAINGGTTIGAVGSAQVDEMTTAYIDDSLTFYAQMSDATGAGVDATGTPTYRVYKENGDTPILTGSMVLLDDPNTVGLYSAKVALSVANGFEVGKSYCVRVAATVSSIAQAGIVERFVLRPPIGSSVWNYGDPGDAAGRATTVGGMLRQVWSYCFNRNSIAGSLQTIYRDDSSTTMLQGAQSASDTAASRGKMS